MGEEIFKQQDNNFQTINQEFSFKKLSNSISTLVTQCTDFAFKNNTTIIFAGQNSASGCSIKAYGFFQVKKMIQKLFSHRSSINCLLFLKKSNQLASGGADGLIIIWSQDVYNQWQQQHELIGHYFWVECFLINNEEDLIFSGSRNKIWKKENQTWTCHQTIEENCYVQSLSLNSSQTKLITCGYRSNVNVFGRKIDRQWKITQTIKVEEWGHRLYFINDNSFIFQPHKDRFSEIYKYEEERKQFIKHQQINVQRSFDIESQFQCQFIKTTNILVVKHGKQINFFQIDKHCNLILKLSIGYKDDGIFGKLTDDGRFLVTWNKCLASGLIQFRRLCNIENYQL